MFKKNTTNVRSMFGSLIEEMYVYSGHTDSFKITNGIPKLLLTNKRFFSTSKRKTVCSTSAQVLELHNGYYP